MREKNIYLKVFLNLLIGTITILFFVFVVPKLIRFFMPFVIGWLIALIANPLVKFMEKRIKIVRKHSSAIIIVVSIAGVVGILYVAVSSLIREGIKLVMDIPRLYADFEAQLQISGEKLNGVYDMLPEAVQNFIDNFSTNMGYTVEKFINKIELPSVSDAGMLVGHVAEIFLMIIITILSAYFFIAEKDNLTMAIKNITPKSIQDKYNIIASNFKKAVGGYFKAQFKIMLILIAIMTMGFMLLGINYGFFLAVGIAILDFLPFFGTGAVLWPWALIDMITGNYFRAICIMVIYLICQIVKQVLQPKMVGDSIGISPLMTLIFMFTGYRIKGIIGMIIGIPIGMVLVNFYKLGLFDEYIKGIKLVIKDINEYRKL